MVSYYTCCQNSFHCFEEAKDKFTESYKNTSASFKRVKDNTLEEVRICTIIFKLNKSSRF